MPLLTTDILADLPVIESIATSPDGRWCAASVSPISKSAEHKTSTIWLVDCEDSEATRRLSIGIAHDHAPRWSPDGTQLAFLSDRKARGTAQLQLLTMAGGEALPLTEEETGVAAFRWFPGEDSRIAYLTPAKSPAEPEGGPGTRRDENVYGAFWPSHGLRILHTRSGHIGTIDTAGRHVSDFEISPDGATLALVLWDTPDIDHVMRSGSLTLVDVASGLVTITIDLPSNPRSLVWSLDGSTIYYVGSSGPTAVSSYQLWAVAASGAEPARCLTADAPFCVDALARGRTSAALLVLVSTGTESALHLLSAAGEALTPLQHFSGSLTALSTNADGSYLAVVGSVADRADEVYAGPAGGPLRRVSDFQRALDDIDFGPQQVVTWERAGMTLDGILIYPPGASEADAQFPTVVAIHGGPYGRWANSFQHRFGRWIAQQGYLVLMPNPRGGSGHGAAFAESVLHTVGNEDYLDIIAGVDMLVERGLADPERLGCGGWSQGGFMTAWIVGQTERFKAGVMGAGVSDWGMMIATSDIPTYENLMGGGNPYEGVGPHSFDAQSPISFVSRVSTPVLILHGEEDARVPVSQGTFFHRGLRAYGVPTELVTYPREPHTVAERPHQIDMLERIAAWYQRWIPVR